MLFPGIYSAISTAAAPPPPPPSPLPLNSGLTSLNVTNSFAPKLAPPPGFTPPLFLATQSLTSATLPVLTTAVAPVFYTSTFQPMIPTIRYEPPLSDGFSNLPTQPSPPIPPQIPPKPPFIRRKLVLSVQAAAAGKKNDYANCVCQNRFSSTEGAPVVERALKPKLAPKHANPSMPNLSTFLTSSESSSRNPFSPDFRTKSSNPFLFSSDNNASTAKTPYRLGEEFFASLFLLKTQVLKKKSVKFAADHSDRRRQQQTSDNVVCQSSGVFPLPTINTLTRMSATNYPISDPTPTRPSAAVAAAATPTGSQASPVAVQVSSNRRQSAQDRYAALKDLDDIFRTSVAVQEGE
jgi:hypothetical protein